MIEYPMIIGSTAVKLQAPTARDPSDLDLICTIEWKKKFLEKIKDKITSFRECRLTKTAITLNDGQRVEFDSDPSSIMFLSQEVTGHNTQTIKIGDEEVKCAVAPIKVLYLLKKSHVDYPIYWQKTISDYHHLISLNDGMMNIPLLEAYEVRREETKRRYAKKKRKISLKTKNDDFFKQYNIERAFNHDDIHEAVKFYNKPMYQVIKRDPDQAWCDWDLFSHLTYHKQLCVVREEAYVIALERFLFPGFLKGHLKITSNLYSNKLLDSAAGRRAFAAALELLCTRLWSGPWAWFVINNYYEVKTEPCFDRDKIIDLFKKLEPYVQPDS